MPLKREAQVKRLVRIEGQIRGIARMVHDERPRDEVLTQFQAVKTALKKVEGEILKEHVAACIAITAQNGAARHGQAVDDLIDFIGRLKS